MQNGEVPSVRRPVASVSSTDSLVTQLLDQPVWSEIRGHGEGTVAAAARAVRLGALIASLEIRRQRGDSAMVAIRSDVAKLLDSFPDGAGAAAQYRALSLTSPDADLQSAARLAERACGWRGVRVGAWLQRARFAAAMSDSAYFGQSASRAVTQFAITLDGSAEAEAAARQFEQVVRHRPHDWTAITTAVEDLLRQLGDR
jgi:hypothetical protein